MLKGQEGQSDFLFMTYHLYHKGFFYKDKTKRKQDPQKWLEFAIGITIMVFTQIYFMQQVAMENQEKLAAIYDVSATAAQGPDVFLMYTYGKDQSKFDGMLNSYKEMSDDNFQKKFTGVSCDANSRSSVEP